MENTNENDNQINYTIHNSNKLIENIKSNDILLNQGAEAVNRIFNFILIEIISHKIPRKN